MYGWMGKIIRVNLTDETIKVEPLNMEDAKLYAGGRGLGTKIYSDEVNPEADPLSPENKLIFITGPLTGTLAAFAGRYEIVAKAPLTGAIGSCSSGGHFGPEIKFAGYDGIIFEGNAKKPTYLYVNDDHIELRDASHLWGKEVSAATDAIAKETAADVKIACIGPAGEKLVLFAVIMNDKSRAAGHSGLGAVMGSKNLKAIAVRGTQSIKVAQKQEFLNACLKARQIMKDNPVIGAGLPAYGTQIHPARSWQLTYDAKTDDISGETLAKKYPIRNRGCYDCSIGCGKIAKNERSQFARLGEVSEHEAGWSFLSDYGINNPEAVCDTNFLCNELGMDTIAMGSTIACVMELFQRGYATTEDIGMNLSFGDPDAIVKLTKMTGRREGFGDLMALGPNRMADKFGHSELSMSVKKQEMPVVTEDKAAALKTFQVLTAVVDSAGICLFATFEIGLPEIAAMFRTGTGLAYTDEEVLKIGERIRDLEKHLRPEKTVLAGKTIPCL